MATAIATITDLQNINNDLTASYELTDDIDGTGVSFDPIGDSTHPFTGILEGWGYKIRNLTITLSAAGTQRGALIDTNEGVIQRIYLEDCAISVTATGTSGRAYAAGITIYNNGGTISTCGVTGTIAALAPSTTSGFTSEAAGVVISNYGTSMCCYSTATITVSGRHVAADGFAGTNYSSAGIIKLCYATGNVTATGTGHVYANGFADNTGSDTSITDCYAKGTATATGGSTNYAAGFVRYNDGTITNAYSIGAPTGADGVGGFCHNGSSGTITNCFWDTTTSGTGTSDGGTGKTTAQMKTEATFTDADWDFVDIWDILSTVNSGYPYLLNFARPPYTTPVIYDPQGRITKGARIQARRNDTGAIVETQTLGANGKATFTELPNDVGVTFQATWGGISSSDKSQLLYSTIIGVAEGGTGSSNAATARTNLGLGTGDSPQFAALAIAGKLEVSTTDWTDYLPLVNITNLDVNAIQSYALLLRGGANNLVGLTFQVQDYDGNTDFVITGNGKVGIGTTPFQKLTLEHGHYIAWETVAGQANSRSWGIRNDLDNFGDFSIRSSDANDNTLDTTRLVIDKDGNVGIGTTGPSEALDVVGNIAVNGTVDGIDVSTHDAATTGVHGVGTGTIAEVADAVAFALMLGG